VYFICGGGGRERGGRAVRGEGGVAGGTLKK